MRIVRHNGFPCIGGLLDINKNEDPDQKDHEGNPEVNIGYYVFNQ